MKLSHCLASSYLNQVPELFIHSYTSGRSGISPDLSSSSNHILVKKCNYSAHIFVYFIVLICHNRYSDQQSPNFPLLYLLLSNICCFTENKRSEMRMSKNHCRKSYASSNVTRSASDLAGEVGRIRSQKPAL